MVAGQDMKELGRRAGIASGIARKRSKETRDVARLILGLQFLPKGNLATEIKKVGIDVKTPVQLREAICAVMGCQALKGNVKAAKFLFDIAEETPDAKETKLKVVQLEKMVNAIDAEVVKPKAGPEVTPEEISESLSRMGVIDG